MKKILLAFNELRPGRDMFGYAVQLCSRMHGQLALFQVLNPRRYRSLFSGTWRRLDWAHRFLETTMSAAAYAEAGADALAKHCLNEGRREIEELLDLPRAAGVPCTVDQSLGTPVPQVCSFLEANPDVVMVLFDAGRTVPRRKQETTIRLLQRKIPQELGIPLIVPKTTTFNQEPGHEVLEDIQATIAKNS